MAIRFLPASLFKDLPTPEGSFVVPDVFLPHLLHPAPVQIWYGSRFSAKSYTKADEYLAKACGKTYFRGIYARQNKEDVKNSQYQLFKDKINRKPWLKRQFEVRDSDYVIVNRNTGNRLIPGSFDHPEKIMSIADPTDIWVEEPITRKGEIKRSDFFDMFGSLRNPYGVAPRFHFTFNPISIDSWIYEDFFDKKTIPSHRVLANYDDNPFCPPSAHSFFEWLEKVDPDRYLIDAKGKWGVPRPENPYFHRFDSNLHLGKCVYDPKLPVYIIHDFNVINSVVVMQKQNKGIQFIEEIHIKNMDLKEVCRTIALRYGRNQINFSGDASGNARSAYTVGNMSAWNLIRGYMNEFGARMCNYDGVPQSNPSTESSCFICNAIIQHYGDKFTIDAEHCPGLVVDIRRMMRTSDGSLDKAHCNKYNYGHLGDCARYALCNFEYTTYKRIISQHGQPN
ncbi:phage terminase large subunit [Spirosoma arcticum]